MSKPACESLSKAGQRCKAFALPGERTCWTHSPTHAEERRRACSAGGRKATQLRSIRGQRSRLSTVPELVRFTADLIHKTVEREIEVDVARATLYGLSIQKGLVEMSDVEKRLEALEQRLGEQGGRKWA